MMELLYTTTTLLSIITFAIATAFTPGPNNLMLLSSGLTFGYKRTLPHIFGVAFGFPVMVLAVGLGVDVLFGLHPWIYPALKVMGLLYLLWMAWNIATSSGTIMIDKKATKPFTFIQSALFQWVNPKAWMMAVTVTSTYTDVDKSMFWQVLVLALVYAVVGIGSTHSWALGGTFLTKWLKSEGSVRVFNVVMAVLIVGSVLPFVF
jgi:threonine/homoserine/homoserine lactone efflux protein